MDRIQDINERRGTSEALELLRRFRRSRAERYMSKMFYYYFGRPPSALRSEPEARVVYALMQHYTQEVQATEAKYQRLFKDCLHKQFVDEWAAELADFARQSAQKHCDIARKVLCYHLDAADLPYPALDA